VEEDHGRAEIAYVDAAVEWIVEQYKQAKTAAAKHAAWCRLGSLWPLLGGVRRGRHQHRQLGRAGVWGSARHEMNDVRNWRMWQADHQNSPDMFSSASRLQS